jgi:hypothetical protein
MELRNPNTIGNCLAKNPLGKNFTMKIRRDAKRCIDELHLDFRSAIGDRKPAPLVLTDIPNCCAKRYDTAHIAVVDCFPYRNRLH